MDINSEELKNKYNNGVPMSLEKMSKEEIDQAMHIWAEGSENLEKVLRESYRKGLLSYACCAGGGGTHSVFPYIRFNLHDDKSRKMAIYLARQLIENELDCEIEFQVEDFSRELINFDIETLMRNREEVFGKMVEFLGEIEKIDLDSIEIPTDRDKIPNQKFKSAQLVESAIKESIEQGITIYEIGIDENNIEMLLNSPKIQIDKWLSIED